MLRTLAVGVLLGSFCFGASILNSNVVDTTQYRVTTFASGLSLPLSLVELSDSSIAALTSPFFSSGNILRFSDPGGTGVASGPGTSLYTTNTGPLTGFVRVGKYYAVANLGDNTIRLFEAGPTPASAFVEVGMMQFNFPGGWLHPTMSLAARATPGVPGSFDLVFNIGSRTDATASTDPVGLTGLVTGTLDGDSIYMVTLNETGALPTAGSPVKLASGLRNAFGMTFAANGDLYFADNAIDGTGPEAPQAEELNVLPAALFGTVQNYGFPNCYTQYITGNAVGSGCVAPVAAFQPQGASRMEGPAAVAIAPTSFPAGFNNGIFIGFSGDAEGHSGVLYWDFTTGQYVPFVANFATANPIALFSTPNALFISDWGAGTIYEVTSAVPEPGTMVSVGLALTAAFFGRRKTA